MIRTWFNNGKFDLDRPLAPQHKAYLEAFAGTRRMKRDAAIAETFPDPVRLAVGLPIGAEGGYYVGNTEDFGQAHDASVLHWRDGNKPPKGQPELWCQWVPSEDGEHIKHNDNDGFEEPEKWLRYIIEHFLKPWGYCLNGEVEWEDDNRNEGTLCVDDNRVSS